MEKDLEAKLVRVSQDLGEMLEEVFQGFRKTCETSLQNVETSRNGVRKSSAELMAFLVSRNSSTDTGGEQIKPYLSMATSYDRMAHSIEGIVNQLKRMIREDIPFSDRAVKELNEVFQETMDLVESLPDLIRTQDKLLVRQTGKRGRASFKMANRFAEEHEERLIQGVCMPKSSPIYLGILESLKGIMVHVLEVTGKIASLSAGHEPKSP